MKRIILAFMAILLWSSVASSDPWRKGSNATDPVCRSHMRNGETCYNAANADSTPINISQCEGFTLTLHSAAPSVVMPELCYDSACTTPTTNMLATALSGTSPNGFVSSQVTFGWIRLKYTSGSPKTAVLVCGN